MSRDFRRFSPDVFSKSLTAQLHAQLPAIYDVNVALQCFQKLAIQLLDNLAPFTKRKMRSRPLPWFTKELKDKCKQRDRFYKRVKFKKNQPIFKVFQSVDSRLKREIDMARDVYISQNSTDGTKTWALLRKFGLVRRNLKSPLHLFSKSDLFEYYSSVTCSHPPCSDATLNDILVDMAESQSLFNFTPVTRIEVYQTIRACTPIANSRICDGLSLEYFKDSLSAILPFLTDLFNLSISTCIYPDIWKESLIVPLSKVPTPNSTSKTRPIANLPHFGKVFDTIITKQIIDFLESNSHISPLQSGFRSSYSTETALLKVVEDIRFGAEKGLVTFLLLFDFKRAFDSINHAFLLNKMKNLDFSKNSIRWFHSYLTGRSQAVIDLDGTTSSFLPSTSNTVLYSMSPK